MLEQRLKALRIFDRKPMPHWGAELDEIDFDNIKYFVRSTEKQAESWEDLPEDIRNTYDRLGIPEAEKQRLVAGVAAQYESEVVYHQIREDLEEKGVIFLDTDSGLREHPELFQQYFGSVIPAGDNKFSALNTAVWSGGSFIYVPPGVHVDIPLQAYFRINTENMGQFRRTLIIVDEDAYVHYVEGCTAPIYKSDSLHSAVVEIIVRRGRCRYTTIQNWSNNVYNLVTKRAKAEAGATMEWVDGNIGSKVTMKYPAVWLTGEHAKGEVLSVAFAGPGQHQDTGSKMVHLAPNTSSNIVSKSVARGGGRSSYRGLIKINPGAHGSRSTVKCDALLVDQISRSDTYPYVDIREDDVTMGHEATVSKVSDDQLFYLMRPRPHRGRGDGDGRARLRRADRQRAAHGYALELNRLIELQMEEPSADGGHHHRGAPSAATGVHANKGELFTSFDVDAFEVPGQREEAWRFTPFRRLRGLHNGSAPATGVADVRVAVATGALPSGLTVQSVGRDDERLGQGGAPFDRIAAQAYSSFPEATIVTVGPEVVLDEPVVVTITGPGSGRRRTATPDPGRALRQGDDRDRPGRQRHLRREHRVHRRRGRASDGREPARGADDTVHVAAHHALLQRRGASAFRDLARRRPHQALTAGYLRRPRW